VTEADNFLPPDNFQETPKPVVAQRTSPTNIGLYLLSVTAAHDMGWIGQRRAPCPAGADAATMQRMPRFRGHLYNWHDTRDLRVLDPAYVSSVDSGNLAGHLIAVAQACALGLLRLSSTDRGRGQRCPAPGARARLHPWPNPCPNCPPCWRRLRGRGPETRVARWQARLLRPNATG
jgi:hypothetical protein